MAIVAADNDEVVSEINVTPLVDVMLVLLVVFIVTAPLLTNAVKVNLPQTAVSAPPEPKKATTLTVDKAGTIYLDKAPVLLPGLEAALGGLKRRQPDLTVHLNADEAVSYGLVAKVMSAVDRAGITRLSVLTAQQP